MEGPHRQLRARLADRLGRDDTDRLAELDRVAGGQRAPVAEGAHAELGVAGEHRAHPHPVDYRIVAQGGHLEVAEDRVGGDDRAVGQGHVVEQSPAVELGLEVAPLLGRVGLDVLHPDAEARAAVVLADDQLLGDVDEAPGEVAGVGGAQGGVDEALAGARRLDEVLQHRQALAEVRLDRPGDHVATGVGHEAAHAGDLADLHHVPAGARAHHHVDGVELLGAQRLLHGVTDLLGGLGPDAHLLLAALTVGDDAPPELRLDLVGLLLELVEDRLLLVGVFTSSIEMVRPDWAA